MSDHLKKESQRYNKRRSRTATFSVKRAQTRLIEHTTNPFKKKNPYYQKQVSKETLSEEIETVALKNIGFENRQKRDITSTCSSSRPIKIPMTRHKIGDCSI